ncbi:response regulator transcription factor [Diplocloster agilis]|uniref:Stage 0 sporulation protein A homolog n=1 Tax=Diplocloster agilis TaxID=2850323 RepID=A0A949JY21_9FIRM|nr:MULTISPECIES: response regulator [Lachnospiraceae]MBU9735852.1 response regulator [Diplocloster agilis]MCU6734199.1 response regulator [Suonthocola fibrivorans]SCJ28365.1 Uncharacterized response regulatory protein SA0215 [uncultured Clostridium sp.]
MLKVFVVEDEPFLLRTIKQMIVNSHPGFSVVGEALNGRDALSLIEELRPDILFTDIRMPFMDGLTLIGELKKRGLDPITVILSGYEEFEYAKKAIRLGTFEYLLKPLSYEILEELLTNLYEKWNDKEHRQQTELLQRVIVTRGDTPNLAKTDLSRHFVKMKYSYFLFCAGSYCIFPTNWITQSKKFWLTGSFESRLNTLLPSVLSHWMLDGAEGSEKVLVIASPELTADQMDELAVRLHRDLSGHGETITTIYGRCTDNINDLVCLLPLSRLYLRQHIIYGVSQVQYDTGQTGAHLETGCISLTPYENSLSLYARNHQLQRFLKEIRCLLDECKEKSTTQLDLERLLKNIIHLVSQVSSEKLQGRIQEKYLELDELISNTSDYDVLYEGVELLFSDLFHSQKEIRHNEEPLFSTIQDVERYLKKNYAKQISIQQLAEQFGMVSSQLSNTFKKQIGMPPSTYLTQLRIEKAKELLLIQPPVTLKDISDAIGYEDPFYFSRVFKLSVGKSPSDYRSESL